MSQPMGTIVSRRGLLASVAATTAGVLAGGIDARADTRPASVAAWVTKHAVPIGTVDPTASLADLAPLRRSIRDAHIVGLGESVHGASEEETLKHRTLRFLVERMGFRTIAWEEQWTVGVPVDDYIRTGDGDLGTLMSQLGGQWQTKEVADVLRWLRDFNAGRDDKVSFVGVEYYFTGRLAYEAVESYVARTAPDRLTTLHRYLDPISPTTDNPYDHVTWYQGVDDKTPYIHDATQVYNLVASVPHQTGDRDHALALHNARQIVSFFVHYQLSDADGLIYRDVQAARNLRWWREFSGDRIAYWAASPHTANAPRLRMAMPGAADMRFPSAGSYLRGWYGRSYVSIGFTFDSGRVSLEPGVDAVMQPAKPEWFERHLGDVDLAQFAIDLRAAHAPVPVRNWENAPVKTRGLPQGGPDAFMDGGTLAQWFDVIVHRQQVMPTRPA